MQDRDTEGRALTMASGSVVARAAVIPQATVNAETLEVDKIEIFAASREVMLAMRRARLLEVDALERQLELEPRTAELRKQSKEQG